MNTYAQNLMIASLFVTRNRQNILKIQDKIFWMNDVAQKMEVSDGYEEGWLKVEHSNGTAISFFPVD